MDLWFTEKHTDDVNFTIKVRKQLYSSSRQGELRKGVRGVRNVLPAGNTDTCAWRNDNNGYNQLYKLLQRKGLPDDRHRGPGDKLYQCH